MLENQQLQEQTQEHREHAQRLMRDLQKTNEINVKLNGGLKELRTKQQTKEMQHAKLKVLSRAQTHQSQINSDALEKAGTVIQKLNEDLQQSLDAASKIEEENQVLRGDLHQSRLQAGQLEQRLRDSEKGMQAKMYRMDNELNLEVQELRDALK